MRFFYLTLLLALFTLHGATMRYARVAVDDADQVIQLHLAGFQLEDARIYTAQIGTDVSYRATWLADNGYVTIIIEDNRQIERLQEKGFIILQEGRQERLERPAPAESVLPFQFGWPRSMSGSPGVYGQATTITDFNGNGEKEIFLSNIEGYAYMWKPNGAFVLGFPQPPNPPNVWSTGSRETAAAGDVNGDGSKEVVFGRWVGMLYAFQYHLGAQLPGFPLNLGQLVSTNDPLLYDFDDDGKDEMLIYRYPDQITYAPGFISIYDEDGSNLPGWPQTVPQYSESAPAIGDIDGDGQMEIVLGSGDVPNGGVPGEIYAFEFDGSVLPGFPITTGYGADTPVTIYDIDMNGEKDILMRVKVGEVNGIYAYDGGGNLLPGFPAVLTSGGSAHGAPAIADVNGDGLPEIAYGTVEAVDLGKVWLFSHTGQLMPGFPQPVFATWVEESVSLEDVSGDGLPDIVCGTNGVGSDYAQLWAFDYQGNVVDGFPIPNLETLSSLESTPSIYDIDGDGDTEIFTASISGTVFAYDSPGIPASTSWPTYKYNAARWGSIPDDITGLEGGGSEIIPARAELYQNYPNPFNPETNFGFRIADFGFTTLRIYDISGRLVKTLLEQELAPGEYRFTWDGRNESGRVLASGVYLYRLRAGDFVQTRKLILLR